MGNVVFVILYDVYKEGLCGDYLLIKDISVEEARRIYWNSSLNEDISNRFGSTFETDVDVFTTYISSSFRSRGYDVKYFEERTAFIDLEYDVYKNPNISLVFEISGDTNNSINGYSVIHDGTREILPNHY